MSYDYNYMQHMQGSLSKNNWLAAVATAFGRTETALSNLMWCADL